MPVIITTPPEDLFDSLYEQTLQGFLPSFANFEWLNPVIVNYFNQIRDIFISHYLAYWKA